MAASLHVPTSIETTPSQAPLLEHVNLACQMQPLQEFDFTPSLSTLQHVEVTDLSAFVELPCKRIQTGRLMLSSKERWIGARAK